MKGGALFVRPSYSLMNLANSPRLTRGYIYFQVSFGSIYAQITLERDQETPKMTHRKCRPSPPYLPTVHCTGHWSDSDETRDCVLCPNDDQV